MDRLNQRNYLPAKFGAVFILILITSIASFSIQINQNNNIHLRLGYSIFAFQEVSASDANAAVKIYAESFKERIEKRLNKKTIFTSKIFNSVLEITEALHKNDLDLISILSTEYFQIKKQHDIYPFLAVTPKEDAYEEYCLIVRKDLRIKHIKDLTGKRLAIPNPDFHPVMLEWLFNYLIKNNMPEPSAMFKQIKSFDKESNAVYEVFFKNSDCCIIRKSVFTTLSELNPQIKNSLTIFATSVPMVVAFLAANSKSDPDLMKITMEEIHDFHLTRGGKNILNIFKANRCIKIGFKDLKSVEEIIIENDAFRKKLNIKKTNRQLNLL